MRVNDASASAYGSPVGDASRFRRRHHQMPSPIAIATSAATTHHHHGIGGRLSSSGRAGLGTRSALSAGSARPTNGGGSASPPRRSPSSDETSTSPSWIGGPPTPHAASR